MPAGIGSIQMIGDIAVRLGFSLSGSVVEDQISEITILKFLIHVPAARCLNHSREKNYASGVTMGR